MFTSTTKTLSKLRRHVILWDEHSHGPNIIHLCLKQWVSCLPLNLFSYNHEEYVSFQGHESCSDFTCLLGTWRIFLDLRIFFWKKVQSDGVKVEELIPLYRCPLLMGSMLYRELRYQYVPVWLKRPGKNDLQLFVVAYTWRLILFSYPTST